MTAGDLSEPERLVHEAFRRGAWVDWRAPGSSGSDLGEVASWQSERVIRAEAVLAVLLGDGLPEPGHAAGVRLRGARISGRVDLLGADIRCPVFFEYCYFDEEVCLAESATRSVRLVGCRLAGFDGTRMRVDGVLDLSGCAVPGTVLLGQAKVTGQVLLAGVGAGSGALAVDADGLSVDGGVGCAGLRAAGAVRLNDARISGSVDLTGAQIACPGADGLLAGNAVIGGRLVGRNMQVDGETLLHDSSVGRIELAGARLHHPNGLALSAGGLRVTGGLFCTGGFTATGTIWLVGARLGANLSLRRASLASPGRTALNLDRATVGDFDGSGLTCTGQISLHFTRVASMVNLAEAELDPGLGQAALVADGAVIDGTLQLAGARTRGGLVMRTGRVGQRMILTSAHLENPGGYALVMPASEITADVSCRDATFIGGAQLTGTRIRGHLDLDHTRLVNPQGCALDARALQAGELSLRPACPVQGTVDLSYASVGLFRDDPASWPGQLSIDGLTYRALEPQLPPDQRLRWLSRHPGSYAPQPYEQLAAHYNQIGQPAHARRVLLARERIQRRTRHPLARTWSLLQDITVGYGYQPWRAALWLVLLLTAGSILFAASPPPPLLVPAAPHFNPVIYTLDLLLPLVDLGQKHAFNPAGAGQWISYLLTAAGWILATTIAAGATRVLSRQ